MANPNVRWVVRGGVRQLLTPEEEARYGSSGAGSGGAGSGNSPGGRPGFEMTWGPGQGPRPGASTPSGGGYAGGRDPFGAPTIQGSGYGGKSSSGGGGGGSTGSSGQDAGKSYIPWSAPGIAGGGSSGSGSSVGRGGVATSVSSVDGMDYDRRRQEREQEEVYRREQRGEQERERQRDRQSQTDEARQERESRAAEATAAREHQRRMAELQAQLASQSKAGDAAGRIEAMRLEAQLRREQAEFEDKLRTAAEQRRSEAFRSLFSSASSDSSPWVNYDGSIGAQEEQARAAAFARAKEQAAQTARASMQALGDVFAERGLTGSSLEAGGFGEALGGARADIMDFSREQLMQDLGRAREVANMRYQGGITQRGQDLSRRQALLGLLAGGRY